MGHKKLLLDSKSRQNNEHFGVYNFDIKLDLGRMRGV